MTTIHSSQTLTEGFFTTPTGVTLSPPPPPRSLIDPDILHAPQPTRSHLSPDDARYQALESPPNRMLEPGLTVGELPSRGKGIAGRLLHHSRTRRRKKEKKWRRLLWVQQSYPDNYTDQDTFLESLQRNPRLKPYEFWPLVTDCTVIVQHVCTVIIFITSFIGIYQERFLPNHLFISSTLATVIGWLIWEVWAAAEELEEDAFLTGLEYHHAENSANPPVNDPVNSQGPPGGNTGGNNAAANGSKRVVSSRRRRPTMIKGAAVRSPAPVITGVSDLPAPSSASFPATPTTVVSPLTPSVPVFSPISPDAPPGIKGSHPLLGPLHQGGAHAGFSALPVPPGQAISPSQGQFDAPVPIEEPRSIRRAATIKSAILISCTLLGLSPILKSLTRSTSSDSIWTMCFCLLAINIFSFDYSGDVGTKFPASLSTNTALMASTVLASRLPSTFEVFSLTLFSIEVFGLFPVFRIYARHRAWKYHAILTAGLVFGAGVGVGIISGSRGDTAYNAILGAVGAAIVAALAMGGCSWWLIGLQKYKNEIYGPWDPARPIIINRRYLG